MEAVFCGVETTSGHGDFSLRDDNAGSMYAAELKSRAGSGKLVVMSRKKFAPLPDGLGYLQPFTDLLARLPPEDLNEDVDGTPLYDALRERLRDIDEVTAQAAIARDRQALEHWLATQPTDDPAHWIVGAMHLPGLAGYLLEPPDLPRELPTIQFDAPPGWKAEIVAGRLDLSKGKLLANIVSSDEFGHRHTKFGWQQWKDPPGAAFRSTVGVADVRFGPVSGQRSTFRTEAPESFMRVSYALAVPGGWVHVTAFAKDHHDFDPAPLESRLHTLRVVAPDEESEAADR